MPGSELFLDVRDLEPPEPLVRALAEIEILADGQYLHMCHRREPCLLYANLEKRGFCYKTNARKSGNFEVFIWRENDTVAEKAANIGVKGILEE